MEAENKPKTIGDLIKRIQIKDVIFVAIIVIMGLFWFRTCQNKSIMQDRYENNIAALCDTITYLENEKGELVASKLAFETDVNTLKSLNEELYNEISDLNVKLKKLQSERLVKQVKRMYENVELFRKRMDEKGLKPEDIKGVEDLYKLPFSYKQDLRDYYPYGLFAVPMNDIVRVHASSGTTGKKIVVGYTENDIKMWSDCVARMMTAVGLGKDDFVQISYGYGLFTGGLGAHYGASAIGATVIPTSSVPQAVLFPKWQSLCFLMALTSATV